MFRVQFHEPFPRRHPLLGFFPRLLEWRSTIHHLGWPSVTPYKRDCKLCGTRSIQFPQWPDNPLVKGDRPAITYSPTVTWFMPNSRHSTWRATIAPDEQPSHWRAAIALTSSITPLQSSQHCPMIPSHQSPTSIATSCPFFPLSPSNFASNSQEHNEFCQCIELHQHWSIPIGLALIFSAQFVQILYIFS